MKQFVLPLILWGAILCQVQGGIITNQQSLTLPDSIALANVTSSSKNETRSGRVMYTASYSNVRIASREPKSMDKYFPLPAVAKKSIAPVANIVPVLQTIPTTTTTTPAPTTSSSTTTEAIPEEAIDEMIDIIEESEPMENDEVVTEMVKDDGPDDVAAVTESNVE